MEADRQDDERRGRLYRLLLENLGGLLALAGVLLTGGIIIEKVDVITRTATRVEMQQEKQAEQTTSIRLDMSEIKARLSMHERDIERLQRQKGGNL